MNVLIICKYEEDPIKNEGPRVFTTFPPIINLWELSVAMDTRVPIQSQGSKCPSLPGLTHWVNPGLPGLGFKPYFGKVGNTGE